MIELFFKIRGGGNAPPALPVADPMVLIYILRIRLSIENIRYIYEIYDIVSIVSGGAVTRYCKDVK